MKRFFLSQVHKELRETMAQLEAIRHEMRTGISIMNPGPMTSHVLENAVPGLSSAAVPSSSSSFEKGNLKLFSFSYLFECFETFKSPCSLWCWEVGSELVLHGGCTWACHQTLHFLCGWREKGRSLKQKEFVEVQQVLLLRPSPNIWGQQGRSGS